MGLHWGKYKQPGSYQVAYSRDFLLSKATRKHTTHLHQSNRESISTDIASRIL